MPLNRQANSDGSDRWCSAVQRCNLFTGAAKAGNMDEIKKRGLIVATEDDFRPFEFVKDGQPTGFDNELIADLRKYAPFEIKQQILPWTGILAGVSTGLSPRLSFRPGS